MPGDDSPRGFGRRRVPGADRRVSPGIAAPSMAARLALGRSSNAFARQWQAWDGKPEHAGQRVRVSAAARQSPAATGSKRRPGRQQGRKVKDAVERVGLALTALNKRQVSSGSTALSPPHGACSVLARRCGCAADSAPNAWVARSSDCLFQFTIWFACTACSVASSARVFSLSTASVALGNAVAPVGRREAAGGVVSRIGIAPTQVGKEHANR